MKILKQVMMVLLLTVSLAAETIEERLPQQSVKSFILKKELEFISNRKQAKLYKRSMHSFYSPWYRKRPYYKKRDVKWAFSAYKSHRGYGENYQRHSKKFMEDILYNADLFSYPNWITKAIVVKNTSLRLVPTMKPHFSDTVDPVKKYPFDNFQNIFIKANTPVLVTHITRKKDWFLVETNFGIGWLKSEAVAFVNKEFMDTFKRKQYLTFLKDNVALLNQKGWFLMYAKIGMQMPVFELKKDGFIAGLVIKGRNNYARLEEVFISKNQAALKPLDFTYQNVAKLADEMIGQPYGWGGLYGNRDCSMLTMDLLAGFGFSLPRHSKAQAKYGGKFISLKNLSNQSKINKIKTQGKPFRTLIWMPSHIMFYIGQDIKTDKPLIYHSIWGIKAILDDKSEDVKIIGKTIVSTLTVGTDVFGIKENLIDKVEGMCVL
ncbi:MAG: hypothetical protein GY817_08125 [bacterium]|nr:hypothetical protein [bacterium]